MAADLARDQTGLAALAGLPGGPLAAMDDGSIEAQTAWLHDRRLQGAQSRALATRLGWAQGNRHLQRVIVPQVQRIRASEEEGGIVTESAVEQSGEGETSSSEVESAPEVTDDELREMLGERRLEIARQQNVLHSRRFGFLSPRENNFLSQVPGWEDYRAGSEEFALAVTRYQLARGLDVDGQMGPGTWRDFVSTHDQLDFDVGQLEARWATAREISERVTVRWHRNRDDFYSSALGAIITRVLEPLQIADAVRENLETQVEAQLWEMHGELASSERLSENQPFPMLCSGTIQVSNRQINLSPQLERAPRPARPAAAEEAEGGEGAREEAPASITEADLDPEARTELNSLRRLVRRERPGNDPDVVQTVRAMLGRFEGRETQLGALLRQALSRTEITNLRTALTRINMPLLGHLGLDTLFTAEPLQEEQDVRFVRDNTGDYVVLEGRTGELPFRMARRLGEWRSEATARIRPGYLIFPMTAPYRGSRLGEMVFGSPLRSFLHVRSVDSERRVLRVELVVTRHDGRETAREPQTITRADLVHRLITYREYVVSGPLQVTAEVVVILASLGIAAAAGPAAAPALVGEAAGTGATATVATYLMSLIIGMAANAIANSLRAFLNQAMEDVRQGRELNTDPLLRGYWTQILEDAADGLMNGFLGNLIPQADGGTLRGFVLNRLRDSSHAVLGTLYSTLQSLGQRRSVNWTQERENIQRDLAMGWLKSVAEETAQRFVQ